MSYNDEVEDELEDFEITDRDDDLDDEEVLTPEEDDFDLGNDPEDQYH